MFEDSFCVQHCRSREGAWIEILGTLDRGVKEGVAPVRERGLKYGCQYADCVGARVAPVRERGLK